MKLIVISGTMCEKSLTICVLSDKILVVHLDISSQIYIFTMFLVHLAVEFLLGDVKIKEMGRKTTNKIKSLT